jgi:AraC-like DNA-binding protein/quercetin dioxygenase-like cupin family protein
VRWLSPPKYEGLAGASRELLEALGMALSVHRLERTFSPLSGVLMVSLLSNRHFPRHSHDEFGIGVVTEGAQRSWSGSGQVEAYPGDVITVNPGEIHDGIPKGDCARHWRMLYFEPSLVEAVAAEEDDRRYEFVQPVFSNATVRQALLRAFRSMEADRDALLAEQELIRLLFKVGDATERAPRFASSAPSVARALAQIDAAPAAPITLADLAATAGVSRFQLLRGFARDLGVTPHAYILQCRVREARRLIFEGETLAQAAIEAGFADQSHMTRAFIRQYGYSPGQFAATIS